MSATTDSTILQHINTMVRMLEGNPIPEGFRYKSQFHFLADKAKVMPPAVCAAERGIIKQCYRNSSQTVLRQRGDERLVYCEGYAVPADVGIPMAHAWILDIAERRVFETTWPQPGLEYVGIAFTKKRKYYGLIDNHEMDFPLLRMSDEELGSAFHPAMEIL